jgi:PPOX class probable F420-dependent enzyme
MPRSGLNARQREFLEEKRFAVVSTINPDGSPHQAVMWYLLDGDAIVLNSKEGRVKDRNLARDPRLSLVVEDGYRWIRVDGTVRADDDRSVAQADIRRIAARYYDDQARVDEAMRTLFGKQHRISYRMTVTRVSGEGFEGQ